MTLINKKMKNEEILKQKEEIGNSLHYIDFHQVRHLFIPLEYNISLQSFLLHIWLTNTILFKSFKLKTNIF